ncbi:MAG: alpha-hydroxy acid oxidase [Flavobacteriales bacterium]
MSKSVKHCYSITDLRNLAQKKLPKVMFDYIEGSAEDEQTAQWNVNAFEKYEFIPRVLKNVENIDLSTNLQNIKLNIPIISAPTGMSRMFHHEGERAVAKASFNVGTAYSLSTVGTTSIEEIATLGNGIKFFQIYVWKNKKMVQDFIQRCKQCDYDGLMLAVDSPVLGKRERDLRNGHGRPKTLRLNVAKGALTRPSWLYNYLSKPKWLMANMINHMPYGADAKKIIDDVNNQFRADVTWKDVQQMMEQWQGTFILKGIQSVEDAVKAVEIGVSGIVLSNHGGRQLDGAPAALDILPEVVEAVGDKVDIIIDGGIKRGSDVIKAIALGAKAVLIGRAYLYGLAAGGEKGVDRAFQILTDEMKRTMQLIGCKSIAELNTKYVRRIH